MSEGDSEEFDSNEWFDEIDYPDNLSSQEKTKICKKCNTPQDCVNACVCSEDSEDEYLTYYVETTKGLKKRKIRVNNYND